MLGLEELLFEFGEFTLDEFTLHDGVEGVGGEGELLTQEGLLLVAVVAL